MVVYRVAIEKYKDSTLLGIGAEKVGGRWNEIGTRAVYCSENASLALLEYYIHSDNKSALPKNLLVAKINIPDEFEIEEIKSLPAKWSQYPYTSNTTEVFTTRAKSRDFFAIKVPSSIVRVEFNYVLNPLYKDFGKVEVAEFLKLPLDDRRKMFK
jgi:RES domain-containing protein